MAKRERKLTVLLTPRAKSDLARIWTWNADRSNDRVADLYVEFLLSQIWQLAEIETQNQKVPGRETLSFVIAKKSKRRNAHGHVIVFRIVEKELQVLHFFHTAQDWQNHIDE